VAYTGSTRGQWVLDHWDELAGKFVKVMPIDYKRALQKLQEEAAAAQSGGVEVAHG
jgi:glutamate synthase domain-containing protein 3